MVWQSNKKFSLSQQSAGLRWLSPAPSLLIKHLHIVPLTTGILWAPFFRSLFWDDFLQALLYHEAPTTGHRSRLLPRWQGDTNVTAALTYTGVSSIYHEIAGSSLPLPTLPEKDGWGSVPRALPLPLPTSMAELIATVAGSKRANLDSTGDAKVAHSQLHSSTCRWHGYTLLSQAALHSAHLLSRQRSRDQHF